MLVLSRRVGESVIINGNIKVMVVKVKGSEEVRIGIEAPKDVQVHREEVYKAIQRERGDSGNSNS